MMNDITNRYSWNNHKMMNKDMLLEEYQRLDQKNKKIIYEYLTSARQSLLDKQLSLSKKKEANANIDYMAKVLNSLLAKETFKSPLEAALTFSIIRHHGHLDLFGEKHKYYSREKDDFNDTKKKMLEWIQILSKREVPSYIAYVDVTPKEALYSLLEQLEYIPVKTKSDLIKEKREFFRYVYKSAGISETSTDKIIKGLIDYIEFVYIETEQDKKTLDVKHNDLVTLLKTKDIEIHKIRQELISMYNENKLDIGTVNDNFDSISFKFSALTILLSDDFKQYGDELLKVHSPIEYYSVSDPLIGCSLDNRIKQEKEIFIRHHKTLTKEHIKKIGMYHDVLSGLPKSFDDMNSEIKDFIDSLY